MAQEKARMMYNDNNKDTNNTENSESTLFSAPEAPIETLNSKRKKNLVKKQRRTVIVLALIIVAALLAYFFVVLPIVNHVDEVPEETVELLEGEVLGPNNRVLIFEHCSRSDISEIEVHNEYGEFGFSYSEEDKAFYVTGHPNALYDTELFSSFIVSTGYTISTERVHKECDNMAEYGLDESQNPAWYTLTTTKGNKHTLYIGDMTPSGGGYYVRYAGRNAVYVLSSTIGSTVLQPLENMITPQITYPMSETEYFMLKDFTVFRGEERLLTISYFSAAELTPEELKTASAAGAYIMQYPTNYPVNTVNYALALETFIDFKGTKTVKYAPTEEDFAEYGLDAPAYTVYYKFQGVEQLVQFSERTEDDKYYVYSPMFNLITEVSALAPSADSEAPDVTWLEWDIIDWVDTPMFIMNINDVEAITVESEGAKRIFDLYGTGEELVVTERESGFKPEVQNFRQFYKLLITTYIQGYVDEDPAATSEAIEALVAEKPYLTLTIETRAGQTLEYKIYPYSTLHAYYTENGVGEFYILRERAAKIISDCEKVMTNTEIDAGAHN